MNFYRKHLTLVHNKAISPLLAVLAMSTLGAPVMALDYGIFEARSLAMGGTGVALSTGQNAHFYNPALLSAYKGKEENTLHGRLYFPNFVSQITNNTEDLIDAIDDGVDEDLRDSVNAFNADQSEANAGAVADASREVQRSLNNIGSQDFEGEVSFGISVTEPGDYEGGAYYFASRVIVGGKTEIEADDLNTLQEYISALDMVAAGNAAGARLAFPNLFDANNNLIDPGPSISSRADIGSLVIAEWGVAVSKEFEFWGQPVAFGITPKVLRVDIYRNNLSYGSDDLDYREDKRSHISMNTDVGIAVPIGESFRLGLAAKDIIPQRYATSSDIVLETSARARFGAAYFNRFLSLGFDVDLQKNEALGSERPSQDFAAGLELRPFSWLDIRFGYRQDLEGLRDDVLSGGFRFQLGAIMTDLSYAKSTDVTGASFQLGWRF